MSKVFIALMIIIVIVAIIFEIWTVITFGNKPASEVPFWAFWLLMGD